MDKIEKIETKNYLIDVNVNTECIAINENNDGPGAISFFCPIKQIVDAVKSGKLRIL